jgi:hypothetical protein
LNAIASLSWSQTNAEKNRRLQAAQFVILVAREHKFDPETVGLDRQGRQGMMRRIT